MTAKAKSLTGELRDLGRAEILPNNSKTTHKHKKNKKKQIEFNLFDGKELSRIEIHPHVNPPERAAPDQISLPPPDRRRGVLFLLPLGSDHVGPGNRRWERGERRLREEPDPRFSDTRTDLLHDASESAPSVVVGAAGGGLENKRSAD